jgi:hypothetical protein
VPGKTRAALGDKRDAANREGWAQIFATLPGGTEGTS